MGKLNDRLMQLEAANNKSQRITKSCASKYLN